MSRQPTARRPGAGLLVLGAALLVSPAASRAIQPLNGAEADTVSLLNVHLDTIISGGHWCRGEVEGFYRVIVYSNGLEEVHHHMYIQLLRVDSEPHDVRIDLTRPVKEAQGLDLVFSELTIVPTRSAPCADVLVEANALRRTVDGQRHERFRMRITPGGDYKASFEPAARALSEK